MSATVVIKHNAEAAHRLPFLPGKCQSLHGHSWRIQVAVTGDADEDGLLLPFHELKQFVRNWVDEWLDHGTMLGMQDPLVRVLTEHGCKVFVFDPRTDGSCQGSPEVGRDLWWPTVENVAELLRRVVEQHLSDTAAWPLTVRVHVSETAVNAATAS